MVRISTFIAQLCVELGFFRYSLCFAASRSSIAAFNQCSVIFFIHAAQPGSGGARSWQPVGIHGVFRATGAELFCQGINDIPVPARDYVLRQVARIIDNNRLAAGQHLLPLLHLTPPAPSPEGATLSTHLFP